MAEATPDHYARAFSLTDGEIVLDDLQRLFGGALWHADEGERSRRIGQREVLEHILAKIAAAKN